MIVCYKFSNFRSFKDTAELNMKAGTQRTLNENIIKKNDIRLLPSSVIYGANASGKSNIIMSLSLMRDIVLQGSLDAIFPNTNNLGIYPFVYNKEQTPILFEIDFINNGERFVYGFEISVDLFDSKRREIVSESLSVFKNRTKIKIFERDSKSTTIKKDKRVLSIIQYSECFLQEIENKINKNFDSTELFLPRAFKTIVNNKIAENVLDFLKNKLIVINDFAVKEMNMTLFSKNMPENDFLLWNDTLDRFVKNADFGPQKILFKPNKSSDNQTADMKLVSIYESNGNKIMVPSVLMESRGTLKLLDFAVPFNELFSRGGVFVLDEFDSAIHPELVKGIISLFNNSSINKNGAQLIFTTHNPIYLNNKIFRRDQIKFVEKDMDSYKSIIYSLAELGSVNVRNDANYLTNYFKGNYSTLPYMDFSQLLENKEDTE